MRRILFAPFILILLTSCQLTRNTKNDIYIDDAYRSIRLLQSKITTGINYPRYSESWGETKGLIDIAVEEGTPKEQASIIQKIGINYQDVKDLWDASFSCKYIKIVLDNESCLSSGWKERHPTLLSIIEGKRTMFGELGDIKGPLIFAIFEKNNSLITKLKSIRD